MEIKNIWFNVTKAQWFRCCGYFRYTSGIFFKKLASELCAVYSSQYYKLDVKFKKLHLQIFELKNLTIVSICIV
jgi:hypothetical protein